MSLSNILNSIEAFEDLPFDEKLLDKFSSRYSADAHRGFAPLQFHLPSFKHYQSEELGCSGTNQWPSISITGADCKLQCDHCKAGILEPMIPATDPRELWAEVNRLIEGGARGLLLSGGSNLRNEVEYAPFLPVIRRIKDHFPDFQIAAHTALVDDAGAIALQQAGIDVAMFDVIGAQDTIQQVYHLRREVQDFEATLAALSKTSMRLVPHIVIGLHYGHLLGEWHALEMLARHRIDALVLVVVMPHYAGKRRPFVEPEPRQVGEFFLDARAALVDTPVLLGCARPAGRAKSLIDAYAVLAGLDGIAYPADGVVNLAEQLGRRYGVDHSCCSISTLAPVSGVTGTVSGTLSVPSGTRPTEQTINWRR